MKIFFVALLWLLGLVFLAATAFLGFSGLLFYAVLSYALASGCFLLGQNILRSRDAAVKTFLVGIYVMPLGVVLCLFGLWPVGLLLLIVGMLMIKGALRSIEREETEAEKLSKTELQDRPKAKEGQPQKQKRSWLSVSRAWLAMLLFVLFGGTALGVGFLFVLGLLAGPGTVGGEFVSLHSAVIVVVCGSIGFMIRRKKWTRN